MANDRGRDGGQPERPAPRGVEQPPDLNEDDDAALDRVWARIAAEDKAKEAAKAKRAGK